MNLFGSKKDHVRSNVTCCVHVKYRAKIQCGRSTATRGTGRSAAAAALIVCVLLLVKVNMGASSSSAVVTDTTASSTEKDASVYADVFTAHRNRALSMEVVEFDATIAQIVGGVAVSDNDRFPYMASILNSRRSSNGALRVWHVCGGSLIAPDVVLGAAHCSGTTSDYVQLGKKHVVGSKNNKSNSKSDVETFRIVKQVLHPKWNRKFFYYDMVLYKLSGASNKLPVRVKDTTFTSNDQNNNNNNNNVDDVESRMEEKDRFTILGWGKTHSQGKASIYLREAEVTYIPHNQCVSNRYAYGSVIQQDAMMCLASDGTDACQGDSGGPLIEKADGSVLRNDPARDVQVGVISWGVDCAHRSYPGIYARIDVAWIERAVCGAEGNVGLSPGSCTAEGLLYEKEEKRPEKVVVRQGGSGNTNNNNSNRGGITNNNNIIDKNACKDKPDSEFFKESWDRYMWNCPKVRHWWWYACLYYSSNCPATCCPKTCNARTGLCGS